MWYYPAKAYSRANDFPYGAGTCNNPPATPILVAPSNGFATLSNWVNSNPTFSATVSDPDSGDTVRAYFNFLQVSGNPLPPADQNGTSVSSGSNSTWTPSPALVDGKYDWRAKAIDSNNAQSGYTGYWRAKKDTVLPTASCSAPTLSGNTVSISSLSGSDPIPPSNGTPSGVKSGNLELSTNGGAWSSVATHNGTATASGEEYTASISNSYSATGTPGNTYAYRYSVADGANNASSVINCGSVSIPRPDLIVQSLTYSPAAPIVGNSMSFSGTVKNQGGSSAAASSTRLRIDIGNNGTWDVLPANQATAALAAGATELETWPSAWTAASGTHKFEICADAGGAVAESNETNNCATQTFTVEGAPTVDLRANAKQNLTGADAILPTSTLTLTWTTTNTPTSCSASGAWSGAKNASGGSETVPNPGVGTFTYTITCSKAGFSNAIDSTTVTVNSPPISTIACTVNPIPAFIGGVVSWNISLPSGQGTPPFDYILDWFWATNATCGSIDPTKTDIPGVSFSSSAPLAPATCSSAWQCSTPDLSPYTQEGFVCLNATVRDPDAGTEVNCSNVVLEVKKLPDWKEIPPEE